MPVLMESFRRLGTVHKDGWVTPAGGVHDANYPSGIAGIENLSWAESDFGSGFLNTLSRPFPIDDGVSVSVEWQFIFALAGAGGGDYILAHLFGNERAISNASATYNGVVLEIVGNNGFNLLLADGGGAWTTIHNPGWTADTDEHVAKVTLEISGANMYWRTYLDGVLLDGPDNDATYSTAIWQGFQLTDTGQHRVSRFYMTW